MDYMKELNVAITVCDKEGKILQMNDKSQKTNHGDLVGQNVFMGLVEFSLEIPFEMPHYIRKPKTE